MNGGDPEVVCFADPVTVALNHIHHAHVSSGDTVLVVGQGFIGLLVTQLLRDQHVNVIATDIKPRRLELARSFGARAVNARPPDCEKQIRELDGDIRAIIECSGSDQVVDMACRLLGRGGALVMMGAYRQKVTLNYTQLRIRGATVEFPMNGVKCKDNWRPAAQILHRNEIEVKSLIDHRDRLENCRRSWRTTTRNGCESFWNPDRSGRNMGEGVRFGIIGCGEVGASLSGTDQYNGIGEWHARYIGEIPGAELVAVCDTNERNAQALAKKFGIKDVCLKYSDLIARRDVDVVNVCTPSGTHGEIAMAAAKAGKHVIVEKPMEVTLERADAITHACHEAGVKLQVVFPFRFGRGLQAVKAAIRKGMFGKILLSNALCRRYRGQGYYNKSSWRGTWGMDGGGACMNQGTISSIPTCP